MLSGKNHGYAKYATKGSADEARMVSKRMKSSILILLLCTYIVTTRFYIVVLRRYCMGKKCLE